MESRKRELKALLWGVGFISFGVVLMLIILYLEEHYHPTSLKAHIGLLFGGHAAIACWILGIVGIIVEFKNWRDYFEERLASTIHKKEYLRTLGQAELKAHLRDVFQAYYRDKVKNLVYEGSFLEFFNTKMQDYIAFPFREDVQGIVFVHDPTPEDCCLVTEDVSYKCRTVDAESSIIQKEIKWSTDYNDVIGELKDYSVALQLPEKLPTNFSRPQEVDCDGKIVFKKGNPKFKPCEGAHGFELSIEEFKEVDRLQVDLHVEYQIPLNKFFAWVVNKPSRGFQAIIRYPEEYLELVTETFGMEDSNKTEKKQPGLYSLTYDSWLLPDYGLSYQFRKVPAKVPAATGKPAVSIPGNSQGNGQQLETPVPPAIATSGNGSTHDQVPAALPAQTEEPKDPK
jgi:hypothetical protein